MAKRKPAARSRRPGRQAASAQPRAKKRARRASSARRAGAGASKKATRAKAPARAKATVGGAKVRRAKSARRATRPAKPARTVRKNRPQATRPSAKAAKPVKPATTARADAVKPSTGRKRVPAAPARPKPALSAVPPLESSRRKRAPDLNRERRRVQDDDAVVSPTPPSSLGLDRTASAARSGRQELRDRYDNHNETGPALTAGDIDANWESAYSTGDEAPGGDNPTPDQNVVDDIGLAVGVAYDDNEELEGADRIEERDRHRWEFDPASSDDFDER